MIPYLRTLSIVTMLGLIIVTAGGAIETGDYSLAWPAPFAAATLAWLIRSKPNA